MKSAKCVVAENLFENCDGEIELISNKSCDNVYLRNTIVGCAGALTLRHGNGYVVRENLIERCRRSGLREVGSHQIETFLVLIANPAKLGRRGQVEVADEVPSPVPRSDDRYRDLHDLYARLVWAAFCQRTEKRRREF